jgi:2',3'-cyclic-nucleotide 2'-phosphodiesterase (5'-nucleotidase family)
MVLYHTSDLHNHMGIVQPLARLRAERPGLLIDCGDSLRGSQTMYYRREPIIDELAAARYDMQAMGNREFHYLYSLVRARATKMQHPLLCTNLVDIQERPLPFGAEKRVPLPDGRTLRFFALLVPQYPVGSPWERLLGWRFLEPSTVAREVAATATSDEVLVLLSHLGLPADRQIAAAVPRINLILGGHSHDTLHEPEMVGDVPIVHAGPYGQYVSRTVLDLNFERPPIAEFQLLPLRTVSE